MSESMLHWELREDEATYRGSFAGRAMYKITLQDGSYTLVYPDGGYQIQKPRNIEILKQAADDHFQHFIPGMLKAIDLALDGIFIENIHDDQYCIWQNECAKEHLASCVRPESDRDNTREVFYHEDDEDDEDDEEDQ